MSANHMTTLICPVDVPLQEEKDSKEINQYYRDANLLTPNKKQTEYP